MLKSAWVSCQTYSINDRPRNDSEKINEEKVISTDVTLERKLFSFNFQKHFSQLKKNKISSIMFFYWLFISFLFLFLYILFWIFYFFKFYHLNVDFYINICFHYFNYYLFFNYFFKLKIFYLSNLILNPYSFN